MEGFSLHANVSVSAVDRARLERLAQYCARGPVAMERLQVLPDGRLLYRFKRAWRDGTTHIILSPLEMLEKLAALIPAPHAHLVRYAGILAPAAKWRALIVPMATASSVESRAVNSSVTEATSYCRDSSVDEGVESSVHCHSRNYTWAELMKRVWALDVLECPRCQRRMRIIAASHSPDAIGKILDCLGLPSRAPPVSPAMPEFNVPIEPF
jgi:hypothetical protein